MHKTNRVVPESHSIDLDTTPALMTTQRRSSREDVRRKKMMWFIVPIIIIVFIQAIIATTIILIRKENLGKTSTLETTSTTIEISAALTTTEMLVTTEITTASLKITTSDQLLFPVNAKWKQDGVTVAGGNTSGDGLHQLHAPCGIHVDDGERAIYIADLMNHRIVRWEFLATSGEIVAGGNGTDELNTPTDVTVDKKNDYLIICEQGERRVVRWHRRNRTRQGIIMPDTDCFGVTMDNNGDLYVSTWNDHAVRRWKEGDTDGEIVAGGNEHGFGLEQLSFPGFLSVDQTHAVYVSDIYNNRVMKWIKGAKIGQVVAGERRPPTSGPGEMNKPLGVLVDCFGSVYVVDSENHRIIRWISGAAEGQVILGGNGRGAQPNQLDEPYGISFDRQWNLYVADRSNNRIQKFDLDLS